MLLKIIRKFSSAHRLPHYNGECHNLHGHTWKVVFLLEGEVKQDGMVADFKQLKPLLDAQLPRHRGEMSAAEFCENYNSLAAMHGLHSDGKRLTTEGWIDINHSLTIGNLSDSEPEYVFTEEGGVLTRLELRIETGEDAIYISPPTSELQLAAMSLVWGREGMGALDLAERQELLRRIKAAGFGGFDFEAAGLRLFCEAEYSGALSALGLTAAEDGSPPHMKLLFSVTEA